MHTSEWIIWHKIFEKLDYTNVLKSMNILNILDRIE